MRVLVRAQQGEPNAADCGLAAWQLSNTLDSYSDLLFGHGENYSRPLNETDQNLHDLAMGHAVEMANYCKISHNEMQPLYNAIEKRTTEALGAARRFALGILGNYSRLGNKRIARETDAEDSGAVGATLGAVGASAAVTAAESPELIPLVAPIGSVAGAQAENEIRRRIRQDSCSSSLLKVYEDPTSGAYRGFAMLWDIVGEQTRDTICNKLPDVDNLLYQNLASAVSLRDTRSADQLIEELKFIEGAMSVCRRKPFAFPSGVG